MLGFKGKRPAIVKIKLSETDIATTGATVASIKGSSFKGSAAISWIMGLAIIILAVFFGDRLKEALLKVDLMWVLAGLGCYGLNYGLRGLRWQLLTRGAIRWWPEGLHASCVHGFASYMLPFRTGELALPLVLRSVNGLTLTKGSRALLRARLLDVNTLGVWVILAGLAANLSLPKPIWFGWVCVGVAMILAPTIIRNLASKGQQTRFPLVRKLSGFVDLEPLNMREWLTSLFIWFAVAGVFFCTARAIGIAINFKQIWLLITLQLPLQFLPVQGIANTGNHEGGWVAGLMLLGFSATQSVEFALLSHLVLFSYVLALGPVALLTGRFCNVNTTL
jgi:hypothetical protein